MPGISIAVLINCNPGGLLKTLTLSNPMKQETKQYLLTVEVNIQALLLAYRGADTSIQIYDLPSIEEIIEFEMGWVSSSGLHVINIKEVKE